MVKVVCIDVRCVWIEVLSILLLIVMCMLLISDELILIVGFSLCLNLCLRFEMRLLRFVLFSGNVFMILVLVVFLCLFLSVLNCLVIFGSSVMWWLLISICMKFFVLVLVVSGDLVVVSSNLVICVCVIFGFDVIDSIFGRCVIWVSFCMSVD